jgi:hypothetical protein
MPTTHVRTPRSAAIFSLVLLAWLTAAACRPGTPVIDPSAPPSTISGTVSGTVRDQGKMGVAGRLVSAIDAQSGQRYELRTDANGHYTIKLPAGKYRMELELLPGESIVRGPEEVDINKSDLDPGRDFEIALTPRRQ